MKEAIKGCLGVDQSAVLRDLVDKTKEERQALMLKGWLILNSVYRLKVRHILLEMYLISHETKYVLYFHC